MFFYFRNQQRYRLALSKNVDLLIVLNGKESNLLATKNLASKEIEAVSIDEKSLSQPQKVFAAIRNKPYRNIYFGCADLDFQRFQIIAKSYLALTFKRGALIDEKGNKNVFSWLKFVFLDVPALALEIMLTLLIALFAYVRLPLLLRKFRNK